MECFKHRGFENEGFRKEGFGDKGLENQGLRQGFFWCGVLILRVK
jgi:hypothetical protein